MASNTIQDNGSTPTRDEVINQIISSIAMEELGLSHIIEAEGEKIQYALGTIPGVTAPDKPATMEELLKLNESVRKTLDSTMMNQFFLKEKLMNALSASVMQGPTGPRGPQGPASIDVNPDVEKLAYEEAPYVRNEGTEEDVILKFGIPMGATGPMGAILGTYNTLQELRDDHPSGGKQGDSYLVGNGDLYIWDVQTRNWKLVGNLEGPVGTIEGSYKTLQDLIDDHPDGGQPGDTYLLNNGELYTWDAASNDWKMVGNLQGPAGVVKDSYGTLQELIDDHPDGGQPGDSYLVGDGDLYVWDIENDDWKLAGNLQGPVGVIKGTYNTLQELRNAHPDGGMQGDTYLLANGDLYIWDVATDDWKNVGNLRGPAGPALEPASTLFDVTADTDEESLGFGGELAFESDTLDISIESGPVVKIEQPARVGSIIPFSSGIQLTMTTNTGTGGRQDVAMVGFGNGNVTASTVDPIVLPISFAVVETVQTDFSIPANATITSMSAYFTAMSGGFTGVDNIVTAQLFRTRDHDSSEFFEIPEAKIEFEPITGSVLPSILRQAHVSDLEIEVEAHTRLLMVFHCKTPDWTGSTLMTGYMGASIEFK